MRRSDADPQLVFVHLSSERTLEPVRKDCSFAEKQESQPALMLVVHRRRVVVTERGACFLTSGGSSRDWSLSVLPEVAGGGHAGRRPDDAPHARACRTRRLRSPRS
jgi:hypothetical protein